MKQSIAMLCLSFALTVFPACATPVTYSAEPIEAWIIDAGTKQPLEGVIVIAHWVLEGGIHVDRVGELVIMETTTDKNGRFYFSGWGPIRHWKRSRLTNMDPELLIFKSNYEYQRLTNPSTKEAIEGKPYPLRRSQWNGKTIALKSFKDDLKKYEELFEDFNHQLERIATDQPTECHWKNLQKTIRTMNRERSRLVALGVNPNTLSSIDNELLMNDQFYTKKGGCGSPREFFGGFKQ